MPTREEIEAAAAEIRREWTARDYASRRVAKRRDGWTVPQAAFVLCKPGSPSFDKVSDL